jgi:hypothetical protein
MGLYDIGIEHALLMPIERPQSRDARELDRAATFGRARYQLRRRKDDRGARSDDGTVLTRCTIASRNDASLTPPGSSMGSAKRLSQDTTQLRKRTEL